MVSIDNLLRVDWDDSIFKEDISNVEYRGMESYLQDIIEEYEESMFGEVQTDISDFTFWRDGRIDILDGYQVNEHVIHSVKVTDNGIVCFWCSSIEDEEEEEYYYLRVN